MDDITRRVETICHEIEALRGEPREITPLPGGLTNTNVRVQTPDGDFVLRLEQSDPTTLGIVRDHEAHNTRAAEEAGVGSPYIDYRPDLGVLVVGYVESVTLSNKAFREDRALVSRVAEACRILHDGPRFSNDFNMFELQPAYLERLRSNDFDFHPDYEDHLEDFDRIRRALSVHPEATKPCNNDLLAENFLDDGDKIWIIDYEYSGNNEPSFELGNITTECDLLPEQGEELARAYYSATPGLTEDDLDRMVARVRLQSTVSHYGWACWGWLQAATSTIDYDFMSWGNGRFEKARKDFTSGEFADLLDQVGAA